MSTQTVITRFAPSPTGSLHLGGARTALFNWLYARSQGGEFHLRIEDTDLERSTPEAKDEILEGIKWLGLDWDGEVIFQSERRERHAEVAKIMLGNNTAYKCYATPGEIDAFRKKAQDEGSERSFQSPWRDAKPETAPDKPFVVRLKAPRSGEVRIRDEVQKNLKWQAETLDDLVLLRSDGSATYMLAVVVDDHDVGVTHNIRGDDHLINAARQSLIHDAMDWNTPVFAHIPLVHGDDGKKLAKRHGAPGLIAYRDMGYTPATMRNYLTRLGWSHGNDEVFSTQQAVEWFDIKGLGKSPARFDLKKLDSVARYQIAHASDDDLLDDLETYLAATGKPPLGRENLTRIGKIMPVIKDRSRKLPDLLEKAAFVLLTRPFKPSEDAVNRLALLSPDVLSGLTAALQHANWTREGLESCLQDFAAANNLKLGDIAQPLRAALTGRTDSPSVFDMMVELGSEESLDRVKDALKWELPRQN